MPIGQVTHEDVEGLCAQQVPEGDHIEYKREIPREGAEQWEKHKKLKAESRDALLEEIVAFANGHGGRLVIGMEETKDKPGRAKRICAIKSCHDLAERLAMQARDKVSPQIPNITFRGVTKDGEEEGCVVVDIQESPMAPHRLESGAHHCFVRRADRSEKMTMREIQDLTIDRAKGNERIVRRIEKLEDRVALPSEARLSIIAIATPTTARLSLPWDTEIDDIRPELRGFRSKDGSKQASLPTNIGGSLRRLLRGWRFASDIVEPELYIDIYWDGSVIIVYSDKYTRDKNSLPPEWVTGVAANALVTLSDVRRTANNPDCEYALKLKISSGSELELMTYQGGNHFGFGTRSLPVPYEPPVYAVADESDFSTVVDEVNRDLFNTAGLNTDDIGFLFS